MRRPIAGLTKSRKIVPLRGKRARLSRATWDAMSRPQFHGLVARIIGKERQAGLGSTRRYRHRKRIEALDYYVTKFGPVPAVLRERHLLSSRALHGSADYQVWSRAAYDASAPNRTIERDAPQAGRPSS